MKKINYYIFYVSIWLVMWLPLPFIHFISRIIFYLNIYVVKYRKTVVINNLKNSFPKKSDKEIILIYKKFYAHFFDMFLESMYIINMDQKEAKRRVKIKNPEILNKIYKNGKNITFVLGHYGNWEWINCCADYPTKKIYIYQTLQNRFYNKFWIDLRTKYGYVDASTKEVLRKLVTLENNKTQYSLFTVIDQCPMWHNINLWKTFLNQDTGWNSGFAKIAKKFDHTVVYLEVQKVKRGYYEIDLKIIAENANDYSVSELTEKYISKLEASIVERPEFWLWSHKRWKRQQDLL